MAVMSHTRGYATPATPNALCFHVWICSQVWLNLPSDNCPLFPHLPTNDGHFGYKQKQFAKKKPTGAIITIWLKNGYL